MPVMPVLKRAHSIAVACLLVTSLAFSAACRSGDPRADDALSVSTITELQRIDRKVGTGAEALPGKSVSVHYSGWLYHPTKEGNKGRPFDSSHNRNEPLPVDLGAGRVIPGWEQGIPGMKVGGQRTLIIPPALAYGPEGYEGMIPPNATLVFDIELLDVR